MKQKTLLNLWLLLFALIVGSGNAWADDVVFYTLASTARTGTGSNNSYTGNADVTVGDYIWNVEGNSTLTPWRIGGKSITKVDRSVTGKSQIGAAITKVELTVGAASSITVNSVKLIVASNSTFSSVIDEVSKSFTANSTITFNPTSPLTEWSKNSYYKFVFNVTVSGGNSNKFVEFSNAKFYNNPKSNPSLSVSPSELELSYGETKSFSVSKSGDGELTVESENTDVATVEEDGEVSGQYNVTYVGDGSTTITVSTSETSTYASDSKSVTITASDARSAAGLSYTNASESAVIAAGTTHKQTLTNTNSLAVTYSSSDETVATVASDGTVTLKKAGTVTITASFAGNASYKPGNASYTLTITNKYVADLVFNDEALEKLTTDAAFTNAWTTDPEELGVIFTSSNTSVATVGSSSGEVTIVGAGETTISATINDASYEATQFDYTLTVSKADAPISFSANTAEVALDETESFVAPTLSNEQSLIISWSSSDETVASINSSTGVITFLKAGSTTITATSTENAKYKSGSKSYTLTVTKAAENMPFAAALTSTLGDFTVTADATNTGVTWAINSSSAKASGYYSSSNHTGTAWLVSPYIIISSDYTTLSFEHAGNYFAADANMETEATLWIREKGGDWEELTIATYPTGVNTSTKSSFVSTSNSLSSYSGKKVQIGFKYLGNSTNSGSWWVKNFRVADDREEAPISFEDATVYELLKNAGTFTGQALTNEESLTVSYSSSDEDVATVNSSTGVVTIKAVGETNITATYAETASYKANTATYKLVVTSKTAAAIEYADATATKKITLGTYTHTLTNPNSLTVAYTSSDETVATVNSSTGEVTMLKVGETTITATFTENEDYDGATVSYTLTVIKDDPTLSFANSSVNAGLADGTYQQVVTTTPADLPVTYTSSDETVATITSDGTATLLKAGSTTITASFAGNASYNTASTTYTLTVAIDNATLPFSYNSGNSSIGTSLTTGTTGMMQSGLGSDYASAPKLKFDGTGDYVILKIAEAPGKLTFDIKGNSFSGGTFKVQTSVDGETYTDLKSYTSLSDTQSEEFTKLAANVRYVKWIYTTKSSGNVALGNISLQKAPPATPTFSVAEGEYDEAKSVELSCDTDGATIYYTTNGNTPTSSSTEYDGAISITETTTLKAIAIKDEVESAVASATYTINRPATPEFDVEGGVFDEAFDLHLSTETDGATIYYTTDGTTPTNESSEYSTKVAISAVTTTVKAIAVKDGLTSDVASATYTYDSRTTPTFTLSTTSVDLKVNETSSAVTLTTNSDATPSFTCADAHVTLTGTGNSRTISANAAGTYTVTVSISDSEEYKDASGTITVNVTKKSTTMSIATTFNDGKDLKTASEGLIKGTVKYSGSALSPQPTITFSSSDETVATVDELGIITFKKVGTTTITVSYEGDDEYEECEESYDLVLYDTTPQVLEVTIALNNSKSSLNTSAPSGTTLTVNNVSATLNKGTGEDLRAYDTHVRMYKNSYMVVTAPTGYVLTGISFTEPSSDKTWNESPSASVGTYSSKSWTGSANTVTFTFSAGQCRIASITVTLAPSVTLNKYGYATYCSAHPIDFSETEGFTAWRVSEASSDGTISFVKITDTIKEGQGVLLYNKNADGENKTTVTLTVGESDGSTEFTTSQNKLVGTLIPTVVENDEYFGLSGNKFLRVNAGTVPAGKALLPASVVPDEARELTFLFLDDEVTGIRTIDNGKMAMDKNAVYDLSGRRVQNPKHGLYIVNGKKVIIK